MPNAKGTRKKKEYGSPSEQETVFPHPRHMIQAYRVRIGLLFHKSLQCRPDACAQSVLPTVSLVHSGFSAPIPVCPPPVKICVQTAKNTGTVSHSSVCLSKSLILSSLCASRLGLLTALYAWALIMLTLAKLGKHTRLCAGSLKSSQCAVERLVFLYADFRHCFPSLRALPINADAPAKCREYIISP